MGSILAAFVLLGLLALFFRASTDSWKYALLFLAGFLAIGFLGNAIDPAARYSSGDWCDANNCH
jgi:hypothetical protein